MADDKKKTKIDLKARLGKTTQVGLGGAMPMPVPVPGPGVPTPPPSDPAGGAVPPSAPQALPTTTPAVGSVRPPPNIAPPVGISPGIPLPPFAPQQRQAPRAEPKQSAAQQTIKVEMGEEVALEHKKMQTRAMIYAAIAAIVGAGIGFVAGGSKEAGDRARKAARGAGLLVNDVKAANEKIADLDKVIGDADESMKSNTIPDGLADKLAIPIGFDSTKLDGKDTGSLPTNTFRLLNDYTRSVEAAEKLRETLKNTATLAKEQLAKAKADAAAPTVGFSVLFRNEGGKGMVAEIVTVKDPFPWKGDFKKEYTVVAGGKDRNASRWEKGDLGGNVLPVDPGSVPVAIRPYLSDPNVRIFREALNKLTRELKGDSSNPTNEIPGLGKIGDDLVHKLQDASRNQ
jgi:hypothetical protein